MGVPIRGDEEITWKLNVNDAGFVVSGLRDCANIAQQAMHNSSNDDDYKLNEELWQLNLKLADELEQSYLGQIG